MNKYLSSLLLPLLCLTVTVIFSGCAKKTGYENISDDQKPEGQGMLSQLSGSQDNNANFAEGDLESLDSTGTNPWLEDATSAEYKATYGRSTAPLLPIYFAFDSSAIDVDQFDTLNSNVRYLKENESMDVVIEGNCDERGTADYNIALGEQRAQSVRKYLLNYGIGDNRISTISFGAERPLYPESNETAWAANRRADLVLP